MRLEQPGKRAAAFQADEVARQQLGKVQRRLAGEHIVIAHHDGELVVAVRHHVQSAHVGAIDDDGQVDLATAHALDGQTPMHFAELLERDLVGLEGGSTLTRLLEAQAALLLRPMALRVQVRSFEAVCRAVEARLGIGVLPLAAARSFAGAMGLTVEPLRDAWALRSMRLCTRLKPGATSALGALVGHLAGLAD